MAVFRVGQRVRIVYQSPTCPCSGQETTIRRVGVRGRTNGARGSREFIGYEVNIERKNNRDVFPFFIFESEDLEPIKYERNRIVAWSDCVIDPRKILENSDA